MEVLALFLCQRCGLTFRRYPLCFWLLFYIYVRMYCFNFGLYFSLIFWSWLVFILSACGDRAPLLAVNHQAHEPSVESSGADVVDTESSSNRRSDSATESDATEDRQGDSVSETTLDTETTSETDTNTESETETESHTDSATELLDAGPAAFSLTELTIEDNPNNVLSCFVSWTTDVPATSTVEFGADGYEFRIHEEELVTDHRVLVIGLLSETTYRIRVGSTALGETVKAKTSYTTSPLPDIVPWPTLGASDPGSMSSGWTLTNISDSSLTPPSPCVVVMFDELGRPVWYAVHGDEPDDRGDIDVRYLDEGTVLIGPTAHVPAAEIALSGEVIWEGPPQKEERLSHHFDKLPNGNYLTIKQLPRDDMLDNWIEELDPSFEVAWYWAFLDHLAPDPDSGSDWCHPNSVTLAPQDDAFYFSCRNMSAVFKVDLMEPNEIVWRLGDGGDFSPDPASTEPWFIGQHDPELQPGGNLLIYDNGRINPDETRDYSRVVEYALNEETMESSLVWEFPGDFEELDPWYTTKWFTKMWGDADRLDNGNVLVTAGTRDKNRQSRIFEVTRDGVVV
jgi:hypothetical protein